jgi:hypothetical protein
MNTYLGIQQVTTGGYNPRSNAVVERFMQHLTACLTKCDDSQYSNMRDYLPAIAFAHNTAFNSAINCAHSKLVTGFEFERSRKRVPAQGYK